MQRVWRQGTVTDNRVQHLQACEHHFLQVAPTTQETCISGSMSDDSTFITNLQRPHTWKTWNSGKNLMTTFLKMLPILQRFDNHTVSQVYLMLCIKGLLIIAWTCSLTEIPKWNMHHHEITYLSHMTMKMVNEIYYYNNLGLRQGMTTFLSIRCQTASCHLGTCMKMCIGLHLLIHKKSQTSHCLMVLHTKCPKTVCCKA